MIIYFSSKHILQRLFVVQYSLALAILVPTSQKGAPERQSVCVIPRI